MLQKESERQNTDIQSMSTDTYRYFAKHHGHAPSRAIKENPEVPVDINALHHAVFALQF